MIVRKEAQHEQNSLSCRGLGSEVKPRMATNRFEKRRLLLKGIENLFQKKITIYAQPVLFVVDRQAREKTCRMEAEEDAFCLLLAYVAGPQLAPCKTPAT